MSRLASLGEREGLERLFGPIESIARAPLSTTGFSGAGHERIETRTRAGAHQSLVLKIVRPAENWVAIRTGDPIGREALMLAEPSLEAIWDVFAQPYLAFAIEADAVGLLMTDLTSGLFPDVREPLSDSEERLILGSLARLHARFWESPALDLPWLARPAYFARMLDPRAPDDADAQGLRHPIFEHVRRGWGIALERAPRRVASLLRSSAAEFGQRCDGLPRTLIHGDSKVANFALVPRAANDASDGSTVAAFDWAMLGEAPPTIELGWYLAVNATRLAGTKEQTIARYREMLETERGAPIRDAQWNEMETIGILAGAKMLLWSKALALESGTERARNEWDWWMARLDAM